MDTTTVIEKQFRFPKKIGDKWIKALKSKKYKQASGYLHSPDGYCCIGVLGRVCGLTDIQLGRWGFFTGEFPEKLLKKIPKEIQGGVLYNDKNELVKILLEFNDSGEMNFEEIAEWIENNVEFYE